MPQSQLQYGQLQSDWSEFRPLEKSHDQSTTEN
ncbi:MAG: hypothetical protein ACI87E_002511 [Mariniblastus sp.]|jgi:hypothetical protein